MTERITVYMTEEEYDKIENKVENEGSDWAGRSEYVLTHMRAGESDLSKLDPRTNSFDGDNSYDPKKEIIKGLTHEYQENIDDILDNAIDVLAEILEEMAESDDSSVKKHPRKGYKLEE